MGLAENHGVIATAVLAVLVQVFFAGALTLWAWAVARRQSGRWWRLAPALPMIGAALGFLGFTVSIAMLVAAFRGVSQLAPDEKAAALAHGISRAMIPATIGLALSGLSYLVSFLSNAIGSLRRATGLTPRDQGP